MKRILALAWLNAIQLLRNPGEMVGVIGLPIALTLLFGSAFSGQGEQALTVLVVDEDASEYSVQVVALIDVEPSFETSAVARPEAERLISDGANGVAVLIPAGFGEALRTAKPDAARIEVLRDPASESAYAVISIVQGIGMRMSGNASAAAAISDITGGAVPFDQTYLRADAGWEPEPPVSAEGQVVVASEVRGDSVLAEGATLSSIGFTVWFVLFMTFGSAGGILEEREQGTLRRLLVAPASRPVIIAGKVAGVLLAAVAQVVILVSVGDLLFDVPWGRDLPAVALVLGAYVLAGTGLAVLVTALVRSRDQLGGLSPLISTGLAMLGGCLWPIEVVSPLMQTIARLTPTGWAVIGLTDVVARNQGIGAALLPTAVLLGFAVVSLGIGVRMLRFE